MPSAAVVISVAWAIGIFLRLSAASRRNERKRRRLRRLGMLVDRFMVCRM